MLKRQDLKGLYNTLKFKETYTYKEKDLGAFCTEEGTSFLLWSPLSEKAELRLYREGQGENCFFKTDMKKEEKGVWSYRTEENLHGVYYDFRIAVHGEEKVLGDPYAKACGVNGRRSMAVDLKKTDPEGWDQDKAPKRQKETVIYELHVKEYSWDSSGGFSKENQGKYLAFTQEHTTLNNDGIHPTGLDYLKKLGVTHVQLMPVYDYGSVDEKNDEEFNWGYDPVNYNVPEGSYSSNPEQGEVRIREFKEMVRSLHKNGFRVIMDVVYNHMYDLETNLNKAVPWYYFRTYEDGEISNGSACGNDVASEREMCAQYITESVLYWAEEYHIDGFRFDLMGLLDTDLMNRIRKTLDARFGRGEILLFGEPWAADTTAFEGNAVMALKENISHLDKYVGMFCDDTRDAVKGHVFEGEIPGFVNGAPDMEGKILNSVKAWCIKETGIKAPSQIITYVSAHDNWTLWDKLALTTPDEGKRMKENKLAAAIYMTCQGHLFMLSGEEFARTKNGHENTYKSPISLNRLDWKRAYEQEGLRTYYEGLIALRKQLPGLCDKSETAGERIYGQWSKPGEVGFFVENKKTGEASPWKKLCVIYNASEKTIEKSLPNGRWELLLDQEDSFAWEKHKIVEKAKAAPCGALVLGLRE